MIYATVNMTVGDYSSTCDQNIVLYRGDKNVEIRFVIKGNRFTVLDSTYAQMIIRRPSSVSIFSEPAAIQNDTVILTITEDMIDELKEIGEYTFQIRLYDNSMNARATLPPCNNCLIINQPIAVEGEALVNAAMINDSAVLADVSDIPEEEIFTDDNAYNRTVWLDGDIITDARMNKIENALYYINEKGGGGTATAPYISTSIPETIMVGSGEDFILDLDFSSPNLGKGTLKVFVNDVDVMSTKIDQGISNTTISGSFFAKGTNMVVVYVLDRVGMMSNSLTFYIRYGSTEISSTFDPYVSYDYGATVRYYFTPTALDTSLQLTFFMEIDGVTQSGIPCVSDVRSYYTFPTNLTVGNHECRAWVTDGSTNSNILKFNLIILDATSLVVASDTSNPTVEEGTQLVLDYKVYMKNNTSFITKTYVDGTLVNTGTCTLETAYYRTTSLTEGTHTVKVEVLDVTETKYDFVVWTVTVTASTYTMLSPAKAGSLYIATAYSKSNVDENKNIWRGVNQDDEDIDATLTNFSFNSENGWVDDELVISGNSWAEIPIAPLANNAQYGFTLDIEFSTKPIGVEDAEVLTLWNETDNCGIKITTEQLIMRSKTGNQCNLYFPEDETVSAIFVIDRDEKTAKIYLNGVMCSAFALSDYEAAGQKYLEDFTVNSNIFLGGYNKNGYCKVRNIRVYEVALATNEILDNFMSNVKDKAAQRELVEFQKGNTLPTMTIYCDFSGLGKDDKKPCNIVYNSPDVNLYGESFTLDGKHSMLQYQGTSSMQYPIKNYRINPRNADGKVKLDPFNNGVGETRFTLKADFMSSGHWQNTGMAKFVNDCLYNYNPNDEKSMNPRKWYDLQNGGSIKGTRETINGFPCRLILVNDGETALLEGQQEPTPGNTKDMGVFNFNNDKDNVNTMGLDTEIFPNCISYEVTANSDTSAGAFVPYSEQGDLYFDWYWHSPNGYTVSPLIEIVPKSTLILKFYDEEGNVITDSTRKVYTYKQDKTGNGQYNISFDSVNQYYSYYFDQANYYVQLTLNNPTQVGSVEVNGVLYKVGEENSSATIYLKSDSTELEYLQNSFELRYPDAKEVGEDYGYLGMGEVKKIFNVFINNNKKYTTFVKKDFFGNTITLGDGIAGGVDSGDGTGNFGGWVVTSPNTTYDISKFAGPYISFNVTNATFPIVINGIEYYEGETIDTSGDISKRVQDPYVDESTYRGLKRVIDWVGNCTDEEFVADFEKYFNKQYVLRYYLLVIVCGMVDNLGKNMMLDTWDGKIWYPRFYDMDTICSYDNSGEIKFDVDIEMAQGYWNTSSSRLWTKVRDLFHDDLVATYKDLRQNNFSYDKFMSYFYGKQIAQIPQTYYNKDYDVKYAPYANEYMGKAHGDGYEHLKRWLKRRLIFTDTLFDYAPSYENDKITIRANTLDLMNIEIETYTPVYQHVSFYNGQMSKEKVDGKVSTIFSGTAQTATDQEVLIYGGSNIKRIKGLSSMNPNSMLIGNASKLVELDISNCPILSVVNSNKANFAPHTYLSKLDISNCPQLGGQLNISNSPLLQEVNALGTAVDNILFPTSVRNLETLRVPKTVTSLTLNDAGLLYTIEMEEGNNLQSIALTNCNNLTETINFDLTKTPTVLLDNSFNGEELYMSETTNLTLKNMPSLQRVIFTPNSEYSAFDINNVLNGANYKITTFNNPMMTDFITTAPHRTSYQNGEYGVITPNTAFTANTLDLADTQFQNVKFLCTTDIYNLKVPTTMKNFYCDSAFDIDTDVIVDGNYEVIHNELIEPYTTNYEGEVYRYKNITFNFMENSSLGDLHYLTGIEETSTNCYRTDFIEVIGGTTATFYAPSTGTYYVYRVIAYDSNKTHINTLVNQSSNGKNQTTNIPSNAKYLRIASSHLSNDVVLNYYGKYTPNLIPSSANGSLIFNMYSNNTTQPTSTSPYMWDLTGLKLNDFYTFGMNNWVKANDGAIANIGKDKVTIYPKYAYRGAVGNKATIGSDNGMPFGAISPLKVKQGDSIKVNIQQAFKWAIIDSQGITLAGTINTGAWSPKNTVVEITQPNADRVLIHAHPSGSPVDKVYFNDILFYTDIVTLANNAAGVEGLSAIEPISGGNQLVSLESITMPQRMSGYSVRLVNADITPDEYPTMLYPKLIDTTLPITGKLDYTAYNGSSLAWAYAYTTGDVNINPLDSRNQGNITQDYNKLYGTDFVDIVDVWAYKDDDFSSKSTNEAITKAYIELTNANYKTRIDEVLQWYPNCTDVYLFEDGSVTSLRGFISNGYYASEVNNTTYGTKQVKKITFMEGYFSNLTNLTCAFTHSNISEVYNIPNTVTLMSGTFYMTKLTYISNLPSSTTSMFETFRSSNIVTIPNIPNTVTDLGRCFQASLLNCEINLSECNLSSGGLENAFYGCSSLTNPPILPSNYKGSIANCFRGCTSLTQAPTIPSSVTGIPNCFRDCTALTEAPITPNSVTDMSYAYCGCEALTKAPNIPINCITINNIIGGCSKITDIAIPLTVMGVNPNNNQNSTTYYLNALSNTFNLTNIDWIGERTVDFNITILGKSNISQADIQELVPEHLADLKSEGKTATLTLGETYLEYLTEDEIAQATAKGWIIQ